MNPVVIDIQKADDSRDVVHRAVQALVEGRLVAFPTETVYGLAASALNEQAVARLLEVKGRGENHPLALAIKSADDALDYVPDLNPLGRRLARRCWPGPITLVVEDRHPDSLLQQLPESVKKVVLPEGTVGLRVPAHPTLLDVLKMLTGPIALTSANRTGSPDATTAEEVVEQLGEDVDLVLDDGRCRFAAASSVVRIQGDKYEMLREGVVPEATVQRLSSFMLLLVCTGNTCRSPLAEAIARKMLAERLKCKIDELESRGVLVMSAGIAAMAGGRASAPSVEVARARGLDLTTHDSQPVTESLVNHADTIWTMTRAHRDAVVAQWPHAAPRIDVVRTGGGDVSDPIGQPVEAYEQCAAQLETELSERIGQLEL